MKKLLTTLFLGLFLIACDDDEQRVNYTYDIDARTQFFEVGSGNWALDENTGAWYYTFNTGIIDKAVIDFGAVLVYVAELNSNADRWRALPRTEIYYNDDPEKGEIGEFDYSIEWGYWIGPGYLELEIYHSNPTIAPANFPDFNADFKLVVLDEVQAETLRKNNVDTRNYHEVEEALGITL